MECTWQVVFRYVLKNVANGYSYSPQMWRSSNYCWTSLDQNDTEFLKISAQVLSDEGLRVIREIVAREKLRSVGPEASRGQKHILRGLYYLSPFIRELQQSQELRDFFQKLTGQKLIPHPSMSSSPQVSYFFRLKL